MAGEIGGKEMTEKQKPFIEALELLCDGYCISTTRKGRMVISARLNRKNLPMEVFSKLLMAGYILRMKPSWSLT